MQNRQIPEGSYGNKLSFVTKKMQTKTLVIVKEIKVFKEKFQSFQLENWNDSLKVLRIY